MITITVFSFRFEVSNFLFTLLGLSADHKMLEINGSKGKKPNMKENMKEGALINKHGFDNKLPLTILEQPLHLNCFVHWPEISESS